MNKDVLIVNILGAPGAGKSTGAAYIFSQLKMAGVNAELITEFAKDKTWEHNKSALSNQIYLFGKQYFRLDRCSDQVEVIITDSPLFLSILYNNEQLEENRLPDSFNRLVLDIVNTLNCKTYLLKRVRPYNPAGRNQTVEESDALFYKLKGLLNEYKIDYTEVNGAVEDYNRIVDDVLKLLSKKS